MSKITLEVDFHHSQNFCWQVTAGTVGAWVADLLGMALESENRLGIVVEVLADSRVHWQVRRSLELPAPSMDKEHTEPMVVQAGQR